MVRVVFGQVAQSLATISRQPRIPSPDPSGNDAKHACPAVRVQPSPDPSGNDATFEAVSSNIGGAGVVDLLVVATYCHGLAHALQALQAELPDGTADALTY